MMQTFLPSISFEQSAKWLDNVRLSKQRVECLQILQALTNPEYGWQNHPAVNMWRGYELSLYAYSVIICTEWIARGYKDTCLVKIAAMIGMLGYPQYDNYCNDDFDFPPWLTEEFASNHRAILLGKAAEAVYQTANNIKLSQDKYGEFIRDRQYTKFKKAREVRNWYQQFNWHEKPAQRVNDKWPYLWPEGEKIENLP